MGYGQALFFPCLIPLCMCIIRLPDYAYSAGYEWGICLNEFFKKSGSKLKTDAHTIHYFLLLMYLARKH